MQLLKRVRQFAVLARGTTIYAPAVADGHRPDKKSATHPDEAYHEAHTYQYLKLLVPSLVGILLAAPVFFLRRAGTQPVALALAVITSSLSTVSGRGRVVVILSSRCRSHLPRAKARRARFSIELRVDLACGVGAETLLRVP